MISSNALWSRLGKEGSGRIRRENAEPVEKTCVDSVILHKISNVRKLKGCALPGLNGGTIKGHETLQWDGMVHRRADRRRDAADGEERSETQDLATRPFPSTVPLTLTCEKP